MSIITTSRIVSTTRLPSSEAGNPRFTVTFADGTVVATEPNALVAFNIESRDYREHDHVAIADDESGHLAYMSPVIHVDMRVRTAPHSDRWMRGDRTGKVCDLMREADGGLSVCVDLDRSGDRVWLREGDLNVIVGA